MTGNEELLGAKGQVIIKNGKTFVLLHGELWQVQADQELRIGQSVKVIDRKGLILIVSPCLGEK